MDNAENLLDIQKIIDDLWKGFKKLWWLVIVLMSLCAGLLYYRAVRAYVPRYEAYATFTININSGNSGSSFYYNNSAASQLSKTFPYIITSGVLSDLVAEDLGLSYVPAYITAESEPDTNLFTIKANASSAEVSYKVLESVIKNYPRIADFVIGDSQLDILEESGVPEEPCNASNSIYAAKKGAMRGALLGMAVVLLYAITRHTVKSKEDFNKLLNVKCIGELPRVQFKKRSSAFDNSISIKNNRVSPVFTEGIRTIRTRVEREANVKGIKTILVTSAVPKEGKTTASYNIALSLAMKGNRVLLIDCDLRNPSIAESFGISEQGLGLSDYLIGRCLFKDCIRRLDDPELYFISAGEAVKNSSELLASENMRRLLERVKEETDYVILDTAPSAMLADASALAPYVDGAIFVVRQDYAKSYHIMEGIERLAESKIKILGCVLNSLEQGLTSYGYGGYGKYGRYGRYGKYGSYGSKYYYGEKSSDS